ncbi:unnamed protein product [Staurois parvus]|uniref:Uncharacterized protein n=1 Tax=Staurois parvus TaxID=386267 RepID=A0ABN9ATD8_9NEOB|nr:unnamed protein product [Staurois parvus]
MKSADFRIVSGLFVRPFFGILAVFFNWESWKKIRRSADFCGNNGLIGRFFTDKKSAHEQ